MDINSVQGLSAYTNTKPLAEGSLVQNQNQEAAQTNLNQESARAAQEAFEVNLSREGLAQQAAAAEEPSAPEQPPAETDEAPLPEPVQAAADNSDRQPSQIVNIVA